MYQTASTGQPARRRSPHIRQNSRFNHEHHGDHCSPNATADPQTHKFNLHTGTRQPKTLFFAGFSYNRIFHHMDLMGTRSPLNSWHPQQGLLQHKHSRGPGVPLAFGTTASTVRGCPEGFTMPWRNTSSLSNWSSDLHLIVLHFFLLCPLAIVC